MSQLGLFGDEPDVPAACVETPEFDADLLALGRSLPQHLRMGTSSWSFPGWEGIVYRRKRDPSTLSKLGLSAYGRHPLLRTVGIDRTFYGPMRAQDFRAYAQQVPAQFRFLVKAPGGITMPLQRDNRGALRPNAEFLNVERAMAELVAPACEGLGEKLGVLLIQFPPLSLAAVGGPAGFASKLDRFLDGLEPSRYAVEVRTPALLVPAYFEVLARRGVQHCCVHFPGMPTLAEQFRRSGGPDRSALIVRWMLGHGLSYEEAKRRFRPFDGLAGPDPSTRMQLAQMIRSVTIPTLVIVNNKAEGSSPLSLRALAQAVCGDV